MGEMDKSTEKSKDESEVLAKQEKENDECKPSENNSICEDAPVYAAILSNSPKRHIFKELREMKQFLDSPENRSLNSSARFKKCATDDEVNSFYEEFSNMSILDATITGSSSSVFEPKPLFNEPEPPKLNRFRVAIEKKDDRFFDQCVDENPRFLINTSSDCPTIIQGSQRQSALHIACINGNAYVVKRIFELFNSQEFLLKAYGKVDDLEMLKLHLIECFVNTPDKNANNTPLHFACKNDHLEVVKLLLSKNVCQRKPKNKFLQTPYEIASMNVRASPEGKTLRNQKNSN